MVLQGFKYMFLKIISNQHQESKSIVCIQWQQSDLVDVLELKWLHTDGDVLTLTGDTFLPCIQKRLDDPIHYLSLSDIRQAEHQLQHTISPCNASGIRDEDGVLSLDQARNERKSSFEAYILSST